MTIARSVEYLLQRHGAGYEVLAHMPTQTCAQSADAAHVPRHRMAKGVVFEDDRGYVLAVVPADRQVDVERVRRQLRRHLVLAHEMELGSVFRDCEPGAVPPFGNAYGIETVIDEDVVAQPDVYLEAGDHHELIHLPMRSYLSLIGPAAIGRYTR
jgi:Ala-tRNA(Pro) deacylase